MANCVHTTLVPASPTIAAALAVETAELRHRMVREARAAAVLEMAVDGLDVSTLPLRAIEDAMEAGEAELATEPGDRRAAALARAVAALRALADDDADLPALAA
jgi:hypothetical protein